MTTAVTATGRRNPALRVMRANVDHGGPCLFRLREGAPYLLAAFMITSATSCGCEM